MIHKNFILLENKLILTKFYISIKDNIVRIESVDDITKNHNIMKVPVYNKFNGIDYISITFPLELIIVDTMVFNPYILLSSYNHTIDNDIDFFYQIKKILSSDSFNLTFYNFNYFLEDKNNSFIQIMNTYYSEYFSIENIKEISDKSISILWFSINIIKLYIIYILTKYDNLTPTTIKNLKKDNISKKIISLISHFITFCYSLTYNINEKEMTLIEYNNMKLSQNLILENIMVNISYYIIINTNHDTELTEHNKIVSNKVIKVNVISIDKNIITIDMMKPIIFEKYIWYYYHPNINISTSYVLYNTFNNMNFTNEIIKKITNLDNIHSTKICNYFYNEQKLSNMISLQSVISDNNKFLDDMNILKSSSYSDSFFEYITQKYSDNIFIILAKLFENYSYPLKANKHDLDTNFDHIIYFSLYHYNNIFINKVDTHKTYGFSTYNSNEILHPEVNTIIPVKFKNLYINLLRALNQMICNDFDMITYNMKFYNDNLYKNIIKIFLHDTTKLSVNLFKKLIKPNAFDKFKNIVCVNIVLMDITNKLQWQNLSRKLNYLNMFYKNKDIIYYMDKLNKNIIPENYDMRLKRIIENPFEMYKYLRKEKDFIRWTKFISNHIIMLYIVPISLSSNDFNLIGRLIYLLLEIKEQHMKEPTYINFINFCQMNPKLILDSTRINIKIREFFPSIKTNINLGFLAKQVTIANDMINLDDKQFDEKIPEVLELENKLKIATKKYYKYKVKYLNKHKIYNKISVSDTSSMYQKT